MPLTKTVFVGQSVEYGRDPACFGCSAAMAAGVSLSEFKEIVGRDSYIDKDAYSMKEIATFLLSQGMMFTPAGYIYNVNEIEEIPGVKLNVTIDVDTMTVLEGYAETLGMNIDCAVNGILTRALTQYGARSREGFRYVDFSGYPGAELHKKVMKGHLKYVSHLNQPAILVVKAAPEHNHSLYWDGELLWDPAEPEENNPVQLEKYTVLAWHQVSHFENKTIRESQICSFISED